MLYSALTLGAILNGASSSRMMHADSRSLTFGAFVKRYGRSYQEGSEEYNERSRLFGTIKEAVEEHNRQPDRLWRAGINKLADYTESEFQALRGWDGSARPEGNGGTPKAAFLQQRGSELPKEKIWSHQLTTAAQVKDQGACGSCWAIAAATVLEAHAEIHTGSNRTFSTQQIVSCTPNPKRCGGDGGCKGATAELAMAWVMENGCALESEVPYQAHDENCNVPAKTQPFGSQEDKLMAAMVPSGAASFGMTGWETLPLNKYEPLLRALAEKGPVAVSVSAQPWQMYDSGIFDGCGKDATIDHAVTAVGYGEEDSTKYWVIQNSWGADWGEEGHIRLLRHDGDSYCGTNYKPEMGVACKGDSAPVPVCGMCGVLFDSVVPHFG